jgi:ribonuclease Y
MELILAAMVAAVVGAVVGVVMARRGRGAGLGPADAGAGGRSEVRGPGAPAGSVDGAGGDGAAGAGSVSAQAAGTAAPRSAPGDEAATRGARALTTRDTAASAGGGARGGDAGATPHAGPAASGPAAAAAHGTASGSAAPGAHDAVSGVPGVAGTGGVGNQGPADAPSEAGESAGGRTSRFAPSAAQAGEGSALPTSRHAGPGAAASDDAMDSFGDPAHLEEAFSPAEDPDAEADDVAPDSPRQVSPSQRGRAPAGRGPAPGVRGPTGRRGGDPARATLAAVPRAASSVAPAGAPVRPGSFDAPVPGAVRAPAAVPDADEAAAQLAAAAREREQSETELRERRSEIARIEERVLSKEETLGVRLNELERRQRSLDDRARNLDNTALQLKAAKQLQLRELERIAHLSAQQARQILLRELQDELSHDAAKLVRQAEESAKHDADRRVRSILATCMQRIAGGHAVETTVSVVNLQSDDLKGRIIGREGRNIRTLETLTGIDFIIDDTPSAVILSGFDGVRREIARLTLEKLLQDGRIHPARIEEAYEQARSEIDARIVTVGEEALFEAKVGSVHPELVKLLGRLRYRTSYGQNVLSHSVECAHLAAMIAEELGASPKTARRAALLHDIGKAVSHEMEGPHALVGGQLARRYQETEAVAHAMEAHHGEVELQTVEAVIVQVADALSGARPGARGESLEQYVKRLRDLEKIATRHDGVDKVYAMQAGREIRVVVKPEDVDDDQAALISHKIARDLEHELEYPGQIKVTVIRESRAVDYAK